MTTEIILLVIGALVAIIGVFVTVYRERYATWWNGNRAKARRPRPGTFTANWSVFYGVLFMVVGLLIFAINLARVLA